MVCGCPLKAPRPLIELSQLLLLTSKKTEPPYFFSEEIKNVCPTCLSNSLLSFHFSLFCWCPCISSTCICKSIPRFIRSLVSVYSSLLEVITSHGFVYPIRRQLQTLSVCIQNSSTWVSSWHLKLNIPNAVNAWFPSQTCFYPSSLSYLIDTHLSEFLPNTMSSSHTPCFIC